VEKEADNVADFPLIIKWLVLHPVCGAKN